MRLSAAISVALLLVAGSGYARTEFIEGNTEKVEHGDTAGGLGDKPQQSAEEAAAMAKIEAHDKARRDNQNQIKVEMLQWAEPVAKELSTSNNDVDQALGLYLDMASRMLRASIESEVPNPEDLEEILLLPDLAKQRLLDPRTDAAAKMLYFKNACMSFLSKNSCGEMLEADLFDKESNNAFVVMILEAERQNLARSKLVRPDYSQAEEDGDSEAPRDQSSGVKARQEEARKTAELLAKGYEEDSKALEKRFQERLKRELSVALRFDDFSLEYKERIRRMIKVRPIPEKLLARMGPEFLMVSKFFPQEDLAAMVGSNAVVMMMAEGVNRYSSANKAIYADVARRAFDNPKTSFGSAMMLGVMTESDHPMFKKISSYNNRTDKKNTSATDLLTTNWIGLRPVLYKAVTQGDVAAVNDAIAWADAAIAKIPDKSKLQLDREAAEAKAQEEKWERDYQARQEVSSACDAEAKLLTEEKKLSKEQIDKLRRSCIAQGNIALSDRDQEISAAQLAASQAAAAEAAAASDERTENKPPARAKSAE